MTATRHLEIGMAVTVGTVTEPVEGTIVAVWLCPALKYEVAYWLQGKRVTDYFLPNEFICVDDDLE